MKLSARTISRLGQLVTGDKGLTPYRGGPKLVRLFNDYGANDTYGSGFPSRWQYAESHLTRINGTPKMAALIREILDPREFLDTNLDQRAAIDFLNQWLKYDGYEIVTDGDAVKIRDLQGAAVEFKHPFEGSEEDGHIFIEQQLAKADEKIREGDWDGAITNARSLLEAVLTELERELDPDPEPYDGDLPKLFKRVQKLLNLDPARPDVEGPLKQVLSGLASIVSGLSGLSNKMGDRHVRTYKPAKRHALLVVNAAKTLANFVLDTHYARKERAS